MSSSRRTPVRPTIRSSVRPSVRAAASIVATLGLAAGGVAAAQPATAAAPAAEPTSSLLGGLADLTELRDYVVTVDPAVDVVPRLARELTKPLGGTVLYTYDEVLNGFAVRLPSVAASALRALPVVETVRRDVRAVATGEQSGATWGIDRTDQRSLPLDSTFEYADDAGRDAHVYVIDTGLNPDHAEFTGRVGAGRNFVAGGLLGFGSVDPTAWTDCNGHGTHVSSTAAGTTWGIAKKATVHAVRVINCQGSGSGAAIIAGIDWVAQNAEPQSVANLSLGTVSRSADVDNAVTALVQSGVAVAVAAGNDNKDACTTSPAAAPAVLTTGSTERTDARSSFSNYGTCVDLFAPGSSITAADYRNTTGSTVLSGTSMASPHVAGVLALVRSIDPGLSATGAQDVVADGATTGKVTNPGTGSPNRLLWSGVAVDDPSIDRAPTAAFTSACDGLTCAFDASGSRDDRGIAAYSWSFGDGASGSGVSPSHSYSTGGALTATLTVTDTGGQTATTTGQVAPMDPSSVPCTGCTEYSGTLANGGTAYPAGSAGFTASGALKGWLRGPAAANFDLTLQQRSCGLLWCSWTDLASSRTPGSEEEISRSVANGTYRWVITSTSGSGDWQFWGDPR